MSRFPLPSYSPAALAALISGDLWSTWQKEGWVFEIPDLKSSVTYIRNKPESCRLFVNGPVEGTAETAPQGMNIRLFSNLEAAKSFHSKLLSKNLTSSQGDFAPFIDTEAFAVGLPFPGDEEIPQLRRIFEPSRFRRLIEPMLGTITYDQWRLQRSLTRHKLVAYKPGRRAVLRTKVKLRNLQEDLKVRKLMHLKVENRVSISKSRNLALSISHATENCKHFRTPKFLGTSPAMNIFGHEWIEGQHPDLDSSGIGEVIQQIGKALNEFHQIPLEISTHSPPQILAKEIEQTVEDLAEMLPDYRFDFLNLAKQIKSLIPTLNLVPSVLAHGDLHLNQILLTDATPYLLDFDRAGRGYACMDLGSIMEDLSNLGKSESLSKLLFESYQSATPRPISDNEILAGRLVACLRRSFQPFRSLSPTWMSEMEETVRHCESLLKKGGI